MTTPNTPTPPPIPADVAFLVRWRGKQEGPVKMEELERRIAANEIGLLHEIQFEGEWIPLRKFLELRAARAEGERLRWEEAERRAREEAEREMREREIRLREERLAEEKRKNDLLEAAVRAQQQSSEQVWGAKSRGIFIILGILLGTLGIHNFYAGHYARGAAQLVITTVAAVLASLGEKSGTRDADMLLIAGLLVIGIVLWIIIELITTTEDGNRNKML